MISQHRSRREEAIVEILRTEPVSTQEQLASELRRRHIEATQATISRDLRRLGVARIAKEGGARYLVPLDGGEPQRRLAVSLCEQLLRLDQVGSMLVAHAPIGGAPSLGAAIDASGVEGIVGTVAGDDTVFIQTSSAATARSVARELSRIQDQGRRWG